MDVCTWPISYAGCGATPGDPSAEPPVDPSTGCDALDELAPEMVEVFERMAAEYLWHASGRQYGVCEVTARPCAADCDSARAWASTFWGRGPYPWQGLASTGSWVPLLIGGQWFNLGCPCSGACSCSIDGPSALRLPGPIAEVSSVKIDGRTLDPSEYSVMYGQVLVRTDGTAWPSCQNLLAPATVEGTFEVTYQRGKQVPVGGQVAAGKLACEFALAACDSDQCSLPERIRSITRQGMTVDFFLTGEKWAETGIWIIDSWVNSVQSPVSPPSVRSPDTPARRGGGQWTM